jgi:uncharacterized protein
MPMNLDHFEDLMAMRIAEIATSDDPAHDLLHFERVVRLSKQICREENGRMEIVMPAAWLHDFVNVPKNDPRRNQASALSAEGAVVFLREIGYPPEYFEAIQHAIVAHSFSANVTPMTLEAKIVQDADRLDGLGAIGTARCFATAGVMKRAFYSEEDPFCESRAPDDLKYTVDHFYAKLFRVAENLQTGSGRRIGRQRVETMKRFLEELKAEIG